MGNKIKITKTITHEINMKLTYVAECRDGTLVCLLENDGNYVFYGKKHLARLREGKDSGGFCFVDEIEFIEKTLGGIKNIYDVKAQSSAIISVINGVVDFDEDEDIEIIYGTRVEIYDKNKQRK